MPIITERGASPISRDAYLEEINTRARRALGDSLNIDSESPQGQIFGIVADLASSLDDAIVYILGGMDPLTARGSQLDALARPFSISRRPSTSTSATVAVTGAAGNVLPAATVMSTSDATDFVTAATATIGHGGSVNVNIVAIDEGPVKLADGDALSVPGVSFVTSAVVAANSVVLGENAESDDRFRNRFLWTIALNAVGSVDSIYANLRSLRSVANARIYENDTHSNKDFTAEAGVSGLTAVPGPAIVIVVDGDDVTNIGNMIILTKPAGTPTVGSVLYKGNTAFGFPSSIRYYEAQHMDASVSVGISLRAGFMFDGSTKIKDAIKGYIENLGIGESINNSRLTYAVLSIGGFDLSSISVSGTALGSLHGAAVNILGSDGIILAANVGTHAFSLNGSAVSDSIEGDRTTLGAIVTLSSATIALNGETISGIDFSGDTTASGVAQTLQTAINANSNFSGVSVAALTSGTRGGDALSNDRPAFDVRGLPGGSVTLGSGNDEVKLFGASPVLGVYIPSGSTGDGIAALLQTTINASSTFDVSVSYRVSDDRSHFDIRGLPASAVSLTGGASLFGSSPSTINGGTVSNLVGATLAFNQRVTVSESAIAITSA